MHINYIYDVKDDLREEYLKNYTPVIIPEYFILGTIGNKLIRSGNALSEYEVDRYWPGGEEKVGFLEQYIRKNLPVAITVKKNKDGTTILSSKQLSEIIDNFSEEGSRLKPDIFNTREKILSYCAGLYFKFGKQSENGRYEIEQGCLDSESMFSLLRKAGAYSIHYLNTSDRGIIPGRITFSFEPSVFLMKYIEVLGIENINQKKDNH